MEIPCKKCFGTLKPGDQVLLLKNGEKTLELVEVSWVNRREQSLTSLKISGLPDTKWVWNDEWGAEFPECTVWSDLKEGFREVLESKNSEDPEFIKKWFDGKDVW